MSFTLDEFPQAGEPAGEAVRWTDAVDDVLDGDHVVGLAYATPAQGVVLLPLTNFGIRDRDAATVSVNSSVGVPRKLERIRRNPRVALAFHTRKHGLRDRPEFVLVQGVAELGPPVPDYPSTVLDRWERFEPWGDISPLWRRWQRIYALRVEIKVAAKRVVVWPDLHCLGPPAVHGLPLPEAEPAPQSRPKHGTAPRLDPEKAARRAAALPHLLLGWVGADGFPVAVPVRATGADERGILLETAGGLFPAGERRAGLTAHSFTRDVLGQHQRKHTGWFVAQSERRGVYAPHTVSAYRLPPSRVLYRFVTGLATRRGARRTPWAVDSDVRA